MRGDDIIVDFGLGIPRDDLVYLDAPRLLLVVSAGMLVLWFAARLAVLWRLPREHGGSADPVVTKSPMN